MHPLSLSQWLDAAAIGKELAREDVIPDPLVSMLVGCFRSRIYRLGKGGRMGGRLLRRVGIVFIVGLEEGGGGKG